MTVYYSVECLAAHGPRSMARKECVVHALMTGAGVTFGQALSCSGS